eukprot:scaffold6331_cov195-Cylindrotheca_fusiformis.AAC.3
MNHLRSQRRNYKGAFSSPICCTVHRSFFERGCTTEGRRASQPCSLCVQPLVEGTKKTLCYLLQSIKIVGLWASSYFHIEKVLRIASYQHVTTMTFNSLFKRKRNPRGALKWSATYKAVPPETRLLPSDLTTTPASEATKSTKSTTPSETLEFREEVNGSNLKDEEDGTRDFVSHPPVKMNKALDGDGVQLEDAHAPAFEGVAPNTQEDLGMSKDINFQDIEVSKSDDTSLVIDIDEFEEGQIVRINNLVRVVVDGKSFEAEAKREIAEALVQQNKGLSSTSRQEFGGNEKQHTPKPAIIESTLDQHNLRETDEVLKACIVDEEEPAETVRYSGTDRLPVKCGERKGRQESKEGHRPTEKDHQDDLAIDFLRSTGESEASRFTDLREKTDRENAISQVPLVSSYVAAIERALNPTVPWRGAKEVSHVKQVVRPPERATIENVLDPPATPASGGNQKSPSPKQGPLPSDLATTGSVTISPTGLGLDGKKRVSPKVTVTHFVPMNIGTSVLHTKRLQSKNSLETPDLTSGQALQGLLNLVKNASEVEILGERFIGISEDPDIVDDSRRSQCTTGSSQRPDDRRQFTWVREGNGYVRRPLSHGSRIGMLKQKVEGSAAMKVDSTTVVEEDLILDDDEPTAIEEDIIPDDVEPTAIEEDSILDDDKPNREEFRCSLVPTSDEVQSEERWCMLTTKNDSSGSLGSFQSIALADELFDSDESSDIRSIGISDDVSEYLEPSSASEFGFDSESDDLNSSKDSELESDCTSQSSTGTSDNESDCFVEFVNNARIESPGKSHEESNSAAAEMKSGHWHQVDPRKVKSNRTTLSIQHNTTFENQRSNRCSSGRRDDCLHNLSPMERYRRRLV